MHQRYLLRIQKLTSRQHGVVSRGQLLESGISRSSIGRALSSGLLTPAHRGVYRFGPDVHPLARFHAAVLACGPAAYLSHHTAAYLWGALEPRNADRKRTRAVYDVAPWPSPIDVTVVGSDRGNRPGIRHHRVKSLEPDEISRREGLPVTSPGRTLIDLAGSARIRTLELVAGWFERSNLIGTEKLYGLGTRYRNHRGVQRLRDVLGVGGAPAFTRSQAEARLLDLVRRAELPTPAVNYALGPWEIDFYWKEQNVAVEIDGWRHHSSRDRFVRDRRKDVWLGLRGITVLRLTWEQLTDQAFRTIAELALMLARADRSVPPAAGALQSD